MIEAIHFPMYLRCRYSVFKPLGIERFRTTVDVVFGSILRSVTESFGVNGTLPSSSNVRFCSTFLSTSTFDVTSHSYDLCAF